MKYSNVDLGQIEALLNQIGGVVGLKRALRGKFPFKFSLPQPKFTGVEVGNFTTAQELVTTLQTSGIPTDKSDMLNEVELSNPGKLDLVEVTVGDLGFDSKVTMDVFYNTALSLGLDYCPDETAAQMILQCKFEIPQPSGLQFASDPLKHKGYGFRIRESEGKKYVLHFTNRQNYTRDPHETFIFVVRK